jgi:hypothetical protein
MGQRFSERLRSGCVAGLAVALVAPAAPAGIAVVNQSAEVDRAGESAHFSITFNQPPDFLTVDEFGRRANSFQYEVAGDWTGASGDRALVLTSVVRGDEIPLADALRIRSADFSRPDPDPASGGWGPVLGTVPFELTGNTLTFDAPLALLGDDDGVFAYTVFASNFGQSDRLIQGHVVPLPASVLTGGLGILGLAVTEMVRRRRRTAAH